MLRTMGRYTMLITGGLACPCHLPIVLPLMMGLLGGTALGAWISSNTALVYGLSTVYFVVALAVGLRLLRRRATIYARSRRSGSAASRCRFASPSIRVAYSAPCWGARVRWNATRATPSFLSREA